MPCSVEGVIWDARLAGQGVVQTNLRCPLSIFRYNPEIQDDPDSQPRVPAGRPDGGQWARAGGGSAPLTRLAALQASPGGSAGAAAASDASTAQFAIGNTSGTDPAVSDAAPGAANPRMDKNSPSQPRYRLSELGTYVQRGY